MTLNRAKPSRRPGLLQRRARPTTESYSFARFQVQQ